MNHFWIFSKSNLKISKIFILCKIIEYLFLLFIQLIQFSQLFFSRFIQICFISIANSIAEMLIKFAKKTFKIKESQIGYWFYANFLFLYLASLSVLAAILSISESFILYFIWCINFDSIFRSLPSWISSNLVVFGSSIPWIMIFNSLILLFVY